MRLSELTNEMLSTYKYPNLMAEVKESTYSICTIAEHIGLGRYRKEDDSKVWSKLTGREEILYDEALGLARLFDTKIEYLFSHELNIIDGQTAAYWRWFDFHQEAQRESEIFKATDTNPALFVGCRKPFGRLGKEAIQSMLSQLGKKAHIHTHPHKFRRTLLTDAGNRGIPLQEIQSYAGHKKPDTTMMYVTVNEENVKASFRRYIA